MKINFSIELYTNTQIQNKYKNNHINIIYDIITILFHKNVET